MEAHLKRSLWLSVMAVLTIGADQPFAQNQPLVHITPLQEPQVTVSKVSIQVKEDDGSVLIRPGELVMREHAKGTVLLCHGFKRDLTDTRVMRSALFKDYNTLIFDFRAHGWLKGGECCSFGKNEVRDIQAAVEFIREHEKLKDLPLFGYGMSMGAATLILTQAQDPLFDGLILDSPFATMSEVIDRGLDRLTLSIAGYDMAFPLKRMLSWYAFNPSMNGTLKFVLQMVGMDATSIATCVQPVRPVDAIEKVTAPCFIIGCVQDQQVPKEAFEQVFAAASSRNKKLWISEGRGHVDSFFSQPEQYHEKIVSFLNTTLAELAKNPSLRLVYKSKH